MNDKNLFKTCEPIHGVRPTSYTYKLYRLLDEDILRIKRSTNFSTT